MNGTETKLVAGELEAAFLPDRGMLGVSLRHRGEELLRRLENLEAAADKGSTAGIPLLYPWANRLASSQYRAAGRDVTFDSSSPLLHTDEHGLAIHGVKWALLAWDVVAAGSDRLRTRLDWTRPELLAVFPFRHQVEMTATLRPDTLTIETAVIAGDRVPVSFGFHPYFGIPGVGRERWRLEMPAMRRLVNDRLGIPNGEEEYFAQTDTLLGEAAFDDGFALIEDSAVFSVAGDHLRISLKFIEGYRFAQVFAPTNKDYIALEPMTAPTNALVSGQGLNVLEAGERFQASFQIQVDSAAENS
jgi:aldose 1-epimerase